MQFQQTFIQQVENLKQVGYIADRFLLQLNYLVCRISTRTNLSKGV